MTKFGKVTGGEERVSEWLVTPSSQEDRAPDIPKMFGTSYMRAHRMRNNDHILHDYQTRCEENSAQSTTNADAPSVCGN